MDYDSALKKNKILSFSISMELKINTLSGNKYIKYIKWHRKMNSVPCILMHTWQQEKLILWLLHGIAATRG